MAPRRLIIAMLLLLAFSTALAVLVPQPRTPEGTGSGNGATDPPQGSQADSKVEPKTKSRPKPQEAKPDRPREPVPGVVEASVTYGGPPRKIRVRPGERLILEVRSGRTTLVELGGTGLVDTAGPYDPAVFDVLARSRGERLLARDLDTGRRIALVVVR